MPRPPPKQMTVWRLLLLVVPTSALLWSGDLTVELRGTPRVVTFTDHVNASEAVCFRERRVHIGAKTFSLGPMSDIWTPFTSVTLTPFGVTLSTSPSLCGRSDPVTTPETHDIIVTKEHRCATKHPRWKGSLLLLFGLVGGYLYLTTHQVYGHHSAHPKWSLWWALGGLTVLFPMRPIKTATLLVGWSATNQYLLLVLLDGVVYLLEHAFGPSVSTLVVHVYTTYLCTSRLVQWGLTRGKMGTAPYLWLRSLYFLITIGSRWFRHVMYDAYGVPPWLLTGVAVSLVVTLAIARRSTWVVLTSVSSSPRW